eukprot:scaffold4975_cov112-Isochrysis_galbana.AAC.1
MGDSVILPSGRAFLPHRSGPSGTRRSRRSPGPSGSFYEFCLSCPGKPGARGEPILRAGRVARADAAARAWERFHAGRLRARRAVIWVRFPSLPSLPRVPPSHLIRAFPRGMSAAGVWGIACLSHE